MDFVLGYIPDSLSLPLKMSDLEVVAANLIEPDKQIFLISDSGCEKEFIIRLARVGLENVTACLNGGLDTWVMKH